MLRIGGITEISTIDYPGKVVSVFYLCGCNFSCPFCHNYELLNGKNCIKLSEESIVENIMQNYPIISGVCITGGEPTLQIDGLVELCKMLKNNNLLVKLDTNGYYPERIKKLLNYVDYISMDIKTVFEDERYSQITGVSDCVNRVKKSLEIISKSDVEFEARTTIVPSLIYEKEDIIAIAEVLKNYGVKLYTLQQFRGEKGTLDKAFSNLASPGRSYLIEIAREIKAKNIIPDVRVRTAEGGEEKV